MANWWDQLAESPATGAAVAEPQQQPGGQRNNWWESLTESPPQQQVAPQPQQQPPAIDEPVIPPLAPTAPPPADPTYGGQYVLNAPPAGFDPAATAPAPPATAPPAAPQPPPQPTLDDIASANPSNPGSDYSIGDLSKLPDDKLAELWKTYSELPESAATSLKKQVVLARVQEEAARRKSLRLHKSVRQQADPSGQFPAGTLPPIGYVDPLTVAKQQYEAAPEGTPEQQSAAQIKNYLSSQLAQQQHDAAAGSARGLSAEDQQASHQPAGEFMAALPIGLRVPLMGILGVGKTIANVGDYLTGDTGLGFNGPGSAEQSNRILAQLQRTSEAQNRESDVAKVIGPEATSKIAGVGTTLTELGAMTAINPSAIIPYFATRAADEAFTADRDAGMNPTRAAVHAGGTAVIQSVLMYGAKTVGEALGVIPREGSLTPQMAEKIRNLFTQEGLEHATKDVLFQAGEGATMHMAQSLLDWKTGERPDAMQPDNFFGGAVKSAADWAALGVTTTAINAARQAYSRVLEKLPEVLKQAADKGAPQESQPTDSQGGKPSTTKDEKLANAEKRLADKLASGAKISRNDVERVGIPSGGTNTQSRTEIGWKYFADKMNPPEQQGQQSPPAPPTPAPPVAEQQPPAAPAQPSSSFYGLGDQWQHLPPGTEIPDQIKSHAGVEVRDNGAQGVMIRRAQPAVEAEPLQQKPLDDMTRGELLDMADKVGVPKAKLFNNTKLREKIAARMQPSAEQPQPSAPVSAPESTAQLPERPRGGSLQENERAKNVAKAVEQEQNRYEGRKSSPTDYSASQGDGWLSNSIMRRPAWTGNDPARIADWLRGGFGDKYYWKHLQETGKTLEQAIAEHLRPSNPERQVIPDERLQQTQASHQEAERLQGQQQGQEELLTPGRSPAESTTQQPAETTPTETPAAVSKPKKISPKKAERPAPTLIGQNADGDNVYEDDRGVRSVGRNGVRMTESVRLAPTRAGVEASVDSTTRGDEYKTREELNGDPEAGKRRIQQHIDADLEGLRKNTNDPSIRLVAPESQHEQDAQDFAAQRGKIALFIKSDDPHFSVAGSANIKGFHDHLFLRSGQDENQLWGVLAHELSHSTGFDKSAGFDQELVDKGIEKRLSRTKPDSWYAKKMAADPELRQREGRAQVIQDFMSDPKFREQLQRDKPTVFEKIRDAVLKLVGKFTPRDAAARETLDWLRNSAAGEKKINPKPEEPAASPAKQLEEMTPAEIKAQILRKMRGEPEPMATTTAPEQPTKKLNPKSDLGPIVIKPIFGGPESRLETPAPQSAAEAKAQKFAELFKKKLDQGGLALSEDHPAQRPPTGRDPELEDLAAEMVAEHVAEGGREFRGLVEKMAKLLPGDYLGKAENYLRHAWDVVREVYSDAGVDKSHTIAEAIARQESRDAVDTPQASLAQKVADKLSGPESDRGLNARDFFKMADETYGGTRSQGKYGPSDAYDSLETGVNLYLKGRTDPTVDAESAKRTVEQLESLLDRLPSQTNRSGEKDEYQQFSTPPAYAFVANWLANIKPGDVMLEPNAGTAGLAVHAQNAGAEVYANELSKRRAELLKPFGFKGIFTEDAEQAANILPNKMPRPDVVVMNPPFSHAAERMGLKTISGTDLKHVTASLKTMDDGGRLVAIVGSPLQGTETKTFKRWLSDTQQNYNVMADVRLPRDVYKGYGTTFPTRVLVIDKNGVTPEGGTIRGEAGSLADLIDKLSGVRNERQPADQSDRTENGPQAGAARIPAAEPEQVQPIGEGASETTRGNAESAPPAQPTVGDRGSEASQDSGLAGRVPAAGDRSGGVDAGMEAGGGTAVPPVRGEPQRPERDGRTGSTEPGLAGRGENTGERGATSGDESLGQPSGEVSPSLAPADRVVVENRAPDRSNPEKLGDSIFEPYRPSKLYIPGAKPHPSPVVESAAMASVESPDITYSPAIPKDIVESGKLSDVQLEAITYAGQSHAKTLPPDSSTGVEYRQGFMDGDGTGMGKGRTIAGLILDNFNQGRRKAVWISKNTGLLPDSKKYWGDIGQDPAQIIDFGKTKLGNDLKHKEGVLYVTYGQLKQKGKGDKLGLSRLAQITKWLGPDWDGALVFDEAHLMSGAAPGKGKRGAVKPSEQGLAGLDLQRELPNARVSYFTATSATEVQHLAYAERLGLWGRGTAFANRQEFVSKIVDAGVAAMEIVSRDLKAFGRYAARSLSYDGVGFSRLEHKLTGEQRQVYNELADGWKVVLDNMNAALDLTNADPAAKSSAMSQFWGAQQRFFNQVITSMQLPSVFEHIDRALEAGHSPVIQLTNTGESSQERALANRGEDDSLDDFDNTPHDMLIQMVERAFPTQQYEDAMDDEGRPYKRPVVDSSGNPVHNPQAIAARDALLERLGSIRVPGSPIDAIVDRYGHENVAEVTGRSRRVIMMDDEQGNRVKTINRRSRDYSNKAEISAFMGDKKNILIFSEAGGTGASYHADRDAENQRQRVHILLQAGWKATSAVQGLGRTHRTNEAHPPEYVLVHTDLQGQKRFISTIARRLAQLGALTKGQRETGSNELFTARDNLESTEAKDALRQFYRAVGKNEVPGITINDLEDAMGLKLRDAQGQMLDNPPPIEKFLNRLLALPYDKQNTIFNGFDAQLDAKIAQATADGTLDQGVENLDADKVRKLHEAVAYTDPETGAKTRYVKLEASQKSNPVSWENSEANEPIGYVRSKKGTLYAVENTSATTTDPHTGEVNRMFKLRKPDGTAPRFLETRKLNETNYDQIASKPEAKKAWEEALKRVPEYQTHDVHMITGLMLPIWNKLRGHARVQRTITDQGENLLGRVVPPSQIKATLDSLGVSDTGEKVGRPSLSPDEYVTAIRNGSTLHLDNEWKIKQSRVQNEPRIELIGPNFVHDAELTGDGVFKERVGMKTRYFIPAGEDAAKVLDAITKNRQIIKVENSRESGSDAFTAPAAGETKAFGGPTKSLKLKPGGEVDEEAAPTPVSKQDSALKWTLYGDRGFVSRDVVPKAADVISGIQQAADHVLAVVAPHLRSPEALKTSKDLREYGATLTRARDQMQDAYQEAGRYFASQSDAANIRRIQKAQTGEIKPDGTPGTEMQILFEKGFEKDRADLEKVKPGITAGFGEWYFPQEWKDQNRAQQFFQEWMRKRPLEGSKGFLKQRKFPTVQDGINAGLELKTTNLADLALNKRMQIRKYVEAHRMVDDRIVPDGRAKYFSVNDHNAIPSGWKQLEDPMFTKYGPPTVEVSEHLDKAAYQGLLRVADKLGISHERLMNVPGRNVLGLSYTGQNKIQSQFGTETSVIAHEIGHQLDEKYDLWGNLLSRASGKGFKPGRSELRNIADMTGRGPKARSREEKIAQVLEAYIHAPEKMQEVAPRVYKWFDKFVKSKPELADLAAIKPGLELTKLTSRKAHGGLLIMGHYYAPEEVATVVNNYMSKSLESKSQLFAGLQGASRLQTQFNLGLSAFHGTMTARQAVSTELSLAAKSLGAGDVLGAAKHFVSSPAAPILYGWQGAKFQKAWVDPKSATPEYRIAADAIQRGGGRAFADQRSARHFSKAVVEELKHGNWAGSALRLPAAMIEQAARPIMEQMVPKLKDGAAFRMLQWEMDRNPGMSPDQIRDKATEIVNSVDNRMGQVTHDNTMTRGWMRSVQNFLFRAFQYQAGTAREFGGAAIDTGKQVAGLASGKAPELTHKMAYAISDAVLGAVAGGLMMYMLTGKKPQTMKDLFFPQDGGEDKDGNPTRLRIPGYINDLVSVWHSPVTAFEHKMNPLISEVAQLIHNRDYFGEQIYGAEGQGIGHYMAKQVQPFSLQNLAKMREQGEPIGSQIASSAGIGPAPGYLVKSQAQNVADEISGQDRGGAPMSHADAERFKTRRELSELVRKQGAEAAAPRIKQAIAAGTISENDVRDIVKRAPANSLERKVKSFTPAQGMKVYEAATPEEKTQLYPVLYGKIERAENLTDSARQKLREALGPVPDGVELPAVKAQGDLLGRLAYQASEPPPKRKLGEKIDAFEGRKTAYRDELSRANETLNAIGATDPAELRRAIMAEQKRRGLPTATLDSQSNPTAFGLRLHKITSRAR